MKIKVQQGVPLLPSRIADVARSPWHRIRYQLGAGLLFAVVVPYLTRYWLGLAVRDDVSLKNSLIGTGVALILGYYSFRRLSRYPGVRASFYVLPTFALSYGLVLAVFFFARFPYSRFHFLASFLLCIWWFYLITAKLRRQQRPRIGVVPCGKVDHLFEIGGVSWVRLHGGSGVADQLDIVVADLRADIPEEWERFLADRALAGTLVMHVKQAEESLTGRVAIEHLSENNLGSLIPGVIYFKVKRIWDIALSIALVPLLAPFLLVVAAAIRIDSLGSILFRQERIGYRGRTFLMYKFRTMRDGRSSADPRAEAITRDGDDRVTRVGRILRRYRIDELPQIINILKGEMSWIGPRPEAVPLSRWYEAELPFYRYRHVVRPGITGWAQVEQGHVAEVEDVLSKLHYDFYYIKNFSLWLDVLIVVGTIRTVLNGFGAR